MLTSPGEDEGWCVAVINEDRGEGLFVLRWVGFGSEPSFVRRSDDLGLAAPSTVLAEPVGEGGRNAPRAVSDASAGNLFQPDDGASFSFQPAQFAIWQFLSCLRRL